MITVAQKTWMESGGWQDQPGGKLSGPAQLVLAFGGSGVVSQPAKLTELQKMYPDAHILSCSTAGEIIGTTVQDDSLVVTALHFDSTKLVFAESEITAPEQSQTVGEKLAAELKPDGLVHVMVFSDGLNVNGTALVNGLSKRLPAGVSATGGLVGDGANFKHTYVGLDAVPNEHKVVVIGFYGSNLQVGYGSFGGWDPFGPERVITKSKDNVLYELDHQPALELYKQYLGEQAAGLPATGLLFPLSLRMKTADGEAEVVRTLLSLEPDTGGMVFAGDMPMGTPAKLMKANFERLLDGASNAANLSLESLKQTQPQLAILISCIGRKLVLKERIEEEVEAVQNTVGPSAAIAGFYSYGELCPTAPTEKQCQLHNQTMTITVFKES